MVTQSCPTLCDLMDCSMSGFPVLHYLLHFAQTHIHWVNDVIQAFCHSLLLLPTIFPSLRIFSMSYVFISDGQSIGSSASVLPMNIHGLFPLGLTGFVSLVSKELLIVFSSTTVRKHQFLVTQPSLSSNSHIHTWLLKSHVHHIVLSHSSIYGHLHCFYSCLF